MSRDSRRANDPVKMSAAMTTTRPAATISTIPTNSRWFCEKTPCPVSEVASTMPTATPQSSTMQTVGTATIDVKVNRTERRARRGRASPAELDTPMVVTPG